VSNNLKYLNFSHHAVDIRLVVDFFLLQYFYRYFLLSQQMSAFPHLSKRSLSQRFTFK
jgi:hypothetical protein